MDDGNGLKRRVLAVFDTTRKRLLVLTVGATLLLAARVVAIRTGSPETVADALYIGALLLLAGCMYIVLQERQS